jgi:hypothetical protein
MQVPETPLTVEALNLMQHLEKYAKGELSWTDEPLGPELQQACKTLHVELVNFINQVAVVLDAVYYRRPAYLVEQQVNVLRRVYPEIENLKVGNVFDTHIVRDLKLKSLL